MTREEQKAKYGPVYIGDTYQFYVENAESKPMSRALYIKVLKRLFWHISRAIIVDAVEWKIPFGLGYARIAKRKAKTTLPNVYKKYAKKGIMMTYTELTGGVTFSWFWDKKNSYTRLTQKDFWVFLPTEDQRNKLIGRRGLNWHVVQLAKDPLKKNYDVVNKSRKRNLFV